MYSFFPQIVDMTRNQNTIYETMPDIFSGNESYVNLDVAIDSIAWSVNMLLGVHQKVHGEFLQRVKQQTDDFLANVYRYVFTSKQNSYINKTYKLFRFQTQGEPFDVQVKRWNSCIFTT